VVVHHTISVAGVAARAAASRPSSGTRGCVYASQFGTHDAARLQRRSILFR
jgi:hypothetical protein